MKRFMVGMIGLAMVFAAPAGAQPSAPPAAKDTASTTIQLSPGGEIGKKGVQKTKMTKKTKKERDANADTKIVVK